MKRFIFTTLGYSPPIVYHKFSALPLAPFCFIFTTLIRILFQISQINCRSQGTYFVQNRSKHNFSSIACTFNFNIVLLANKNSTSWEKLSCIHINWKCRQLCREPGHMTQGIIIMNKLHKTCQYRFRNIHIWKLLLSDKTPAKWKTYIWIYWGISD